MPDEAVSRSPEISRNEDFSGPPTDQEAIEAGVILRNMDTALRAENATFGGQELDDPRHTRLARVAARIARCFDIRT